MATFGSKYQSTFMTRELRRLTEIFVSLARDRPLQDQVYRALRGAILSGRMAPGLKLPSTRALAGALSVSRTTTQIAYEQLLAEGYLTARIGSGTFVADSWTEQPAKHGPTTTSTTTTSVAMSEYAERLTLVRARWRGVSRSKTAQISFRLGTSDSSLMPRRIWSRFVAEAARDPTPEANEYGRTAGSLELRRAIASYLEQVRGIRAGPEQIVIVTGIQQGLGLISRLFANPGDAALVEDPGYLGASTVFAAEGLRLVPVPVDEDGMHLEGIGRRATRRARLIHVTPSHQFPTGAVLSFPRRQALLSWARARGAVVFEDDYDSEFRFEGRPIESLYALDDTATVIYAGTFSKTMIPALRIGYLVLPPPLIESVATAKWLAGFGNPTLEQRALARFIEEGHYGRHVRRCRLQYSRRRDTLVAELERHFGAAVDVGARGAGLHLLVRFPGLPVTQSQHLVEVAAREGLEVQRADVFYQSKPPPEAELVLGYACLNDAQIEDGVARLARAMRSLRG
jgi:GntR family transcriptional regulator/MocR family aminotransferase